MNPQNNNFLADINKEGTKKTNMVMNENQAFTNHQEKCFTAADLWNIQRQRKSIVPRRYFS
jgi:hypothetical protein